MSDESSEVKLHALDYWQIIRNRYGVILLAFFLVFMTAGVVTYILPRQYEGRVQLQINPDRKEIVISQGGFQRNMRGDSITWVQTQFEIISSQATLQRVIDELGLMKKWDVTSERDAYKELVDSLETNEVRGTELIDIVVYRTDPQEAADLANAIAASYKDRRVEELAETGSASIAVLDGELERQKARVDDARTLMLKIQAETGIIDLDEGQLAFYNPEAGAMTAKPDVIRMAEMDAYDNEKQIETYTIQINALTGKTGEELINQAMSLNLEDSTITFWKPRRDEVLIELQKQLNSGRGERHTEVLKLRAQLDEMNKVLEEGVVALKSVLATKLAIARDTKERMDSIKGSREGEQMDDRRLRIQYDEAKKEYNLQKQLFSQMQQTFLKERVDGLQPVKPVQIHGAATPNHVPAKPNVPLNLALGAVVGIGFGIGLAFFLEYLDTSVKSLEDVERYLEVPVLAVIPKDVGVLHKQSGISPDAEAYRILRTNIEFNRKSADANAITIVSGGAGEGKSTTLVNLAYVCAQGGYNTLMIDGDLRRPKLHTFFDINNSVGLTNYLTTELMLEDVILQTPIDNLYFMPSGILPADAAGILNSRRMSELISDVKSRFDLVLIDSPPILGVSDASVLASEVDLTMIVIQHRKLPRSMLMRVKQAIENVGGNLLGVVLNNVDIRSDSQYQYYTSYYTYYSPTNTASPSPAAASPGTATKDAKAGAKVGDAY
ncbi:hypothetical protein BH23VER1_BH23VER1_29050 [soil metagenome]